MAKHIEPFHSGATDIIMASFGARTEDAFAAIVSATDPTAGAAIIDTAEKLGDEELARQEIGFKPLRGQGEQQNIAWDALAEHLETAIAQA